MRAGASALIILALLLGGCASTPDAHPRDPWESYNRKVFKFNEVLDNTLLKPVSKGYQAITPDVVESGVSNFFSNIGDVGNSVNNLLQGRVLASGTDLLRVVINSTVGFAGLVDVATHAGLTKHDEDFGQTLAVWSLGSGPYVMLPFFGPSTVRDTGGLVVDLAYNPLRLVDPETTRYALTGLSVIDTRSSLLKAEAVFGNNFFDRYAMLRNAYLQHREVLVHNGKPPSAELEADDLIKQLEEL